MFKRGSDTSSPPAKGGPGSQAEEKSDPIPRHIPSNSITIPFVQRGWTEIAPGKLYYVSLCQTPKYMFDDANINLFNKFKNLWYTMQIHNPKLKISNLIMLQDDLRVQNSTPTDATAFTQVNYLVKYCPKGFKQYFKLLNSDTGAISDAKSLKYQLKTDRPNNPFIEIPGFTDFENLFILPAKANLRAGFVPGGDVKADPNSGIINDVYIAPNTSSTYFNSVSGNLAPKDDETNFFKPGQTITKAINQDKIEYYKYGDTIEMEINTNLEGIHLANTAENNFLQDVFVTFKNPSDDDQTIEYSTEFAYPSRNRPFIARGDYYSNNLNAILKGKDFKPLDHCFLMMPPIKKPGGQLLGQRCSVFTEQEFAITFFYNQGTYSTLEDDAQQPHQDDAVILRRNVYPVPTITTSTKSVVCPRSTMLQSYQAVSKYPDTFEGTFKDFIQDCTREELAPCFSFSVEGPGDYDLSVVPLSTNIKTIPCLATYFVNTTLCKALPTDNDPEMIKDNQRLWFKKAAEGKDIVFEYDRQLGGCPIVKIGEESYWLYLRKNEGTDMTSWMLINSTDLEEWPRYVLFHTSKFLELYYKKTGTVCPVHVSKAEPNKDCLVFFT